MTQGKIPSSWFESDPEWEMLRRKAENEAIPKELKQRVQAQRPKLPQREQPRAQASRQVTEKEVIVNLKLALPKVKLPDYKGLYSRHKKKIIMTGAGLGSLVLIVGSFRVISNLRNDPAPQTVKSAQDQAASDFTPLIPLDSVATAGGKKGPDYNYDPKKKVLAYTGEYNGSILTVSQQALPHDFRSAPGQLQYVAQSFQADNPIETQKGTAYIATNEEANTQTAIFATDDVLVFIQANQKLDTDEWKFYINQLNPSK